ncbi:MAG TPA: GAF domain-containing protein, partial [Treponemataceae bacterium]|nr:GAF domain-containing protein [Treponemataceae bacterium]
MKNLKLLSKIALSFHDLTDFEKEIPQILKDIGSFIDLNRIFLFFEKPSENIKMNFEWCNDGVPTMIHEFDNVRCIDFSFLFELLKKNGFLCCNNGNEIPPKIIKTLHFDEIKSLLIYPLIVQKEMRGFITFNECRYVHTWTEEELEILNTVAVLLSSAFERKIYQEELISSETSTDMFKEDEN